MEIRKFLIEKNLPINSKDFTIIRTLYSSIVGWEAISLYSVLYDYLETSNKTIKFFQTSELKSILNISSTKIDEARKKLEAVGLLKTYESASNDQHLYVLIKPSNTDIFRKNVILFKKFIEKIGDIAFERVHFALINKTTNKDEYIDITSKYQDVFTFKSNNTIQNTLEIPLVKYESIEVAREKMNSFNFISYLSNEKVTPSQIRMIQKLQIDGLSNLSLNIIISYTFGVNGSIVNKYIETIANDFVSKEITSPEEINQELINAKKPIKKKNSQKNNSQKEEKVEKTWEEIFSSIGGEL